MSRSPVHFILFAFVLLVSCSADSNQGTTPDTYDPSRVQAVTCDTGGEIRDECSPSPLSQGIYCCPTPGASAGCPLIGGAMSADERCACDADAGQWKTTTDQHGCELLVPPVDTSSGDMASDMASDMRDNAPISCLDGQYMCEPSPLTPGKYCCPQETPSCHCPFMGGTLGEFGHCNRTCDAAPVGWTTTTDENGCAVNVTGSQSCLRPPDQDMGQDLDTAADMTVDM